MVEYKGNSHKSKETRKTEVTAEVLEKKKVEKVTSGGVKRKKKSELSKIASTFIAEDVTNVKDYIINDVILPTVKRSISDIIVNGIDMLLYGETRNRKSSGGSRVSYSKYYDDRDRYERKSRDSERGRRNVRNGYDYEDIVLESRGDAEDVLDRMDDLLDTYGLVSVADLYDLVGIQGSYTDNKYGWTQLKTADIQRLRDGYLLKLPKATPLN